MSEQLGEIFIQVVRDTRKQILQSIPATYQEIHTDGMNRLIYFKPDAPPKFNNEKAKLFYFATKINYGSYFK